MAEALIGVLARANDGWARRLVDAWGRGRACLILPHTPLIERWALHLDAHGEVRIGSPHGRVQFAALISRVDRICAEDCQHLPTAQRRQAVGELQSFWMALLQGLSCPRLNPPSARSLCGEVGCAAGARGENAGGEGVGHRSAPHEAADTAQAEHCTVTVVGQRVLGAPDRQVSAQARDLARKTHLPLLGLEFIRVRTGWCLERISATPSPAPELAREAIDDHLMRCAA